MGQETIRSAERSATTAATLAALATEGRLKRDAPIGDQWKTVPAFLSRITLRQSRFAKNRSFEAIFWRGVAAPKGFKTERPYLILFILRQYPQSILAINRAQLLLGESDGL